MNCSHRDLNFFACREFVESILKCKWKGMRASVLIDSLSSTSANQVTFETSQFKWDGLLSSRLHQIVQPFIWHIFHTDAFFTNQKRLPTHIPRPASCSCTFTKIQRKRYLGIEKEIDRDVFSSLMCLRQCCKRLADRRSSTFDGVPDVPTRLSIPRTWEDLIVYIVLSLRASRSHSRG